MSPLIIALDFADSHQALNFVHQLGEKRCRVKVGHQLFTQSGPAFVDTLVQQGFEVFLDLKYHDIPNTVAQACRAAAELGVWMVNVHALGGRAMLLAAREALEAYGLQRPLLAAVSILTSLDKEDLYAVGLHGALEDNVLRLARLSYACGLDGLICSPQEISAIRKAVGPRLQLITPGIRPSGSERHDQKRVMSPAEALKKGANYLVIGRPVTAAASPLEALLAIEHTLTPH